ncbi:class A beta-lactamase [Comamonas squillarum]|uniref:Beta-lactamase n=1 Tax=Comamonas squillarum TaxID=2977320 RepID=A0ABY5ZU72_9BURK|nr:class A beta-lactamase [Comamonas sp. PR12]UXC17515.1 class A beta-lactamase [Comamonas sp. PR12]
MQRCHFVAATLVMGSGSVFGLAGCASRQSAHPRADRALHKALTLIEAQSGGRLGVYALDAETGGEAGYRSDERFAMCSTFKTLLAAHVLYLGQTGALDLGQQVRVTSADMVPYAPVTEKYQDQPGGISLLELCEAIVVVSDNVAANLLLRASGGPEALTAWLRTLGDKATRLDRIEPLLNTAAPGDPRDTTTPRAMQATLQALLLGDVLKGYGRAMLQQWLSDSRTGDQRVRAGLPSEWRVGGKTGAGAHSTANDCLIAWPNAASEGLIITAFLTGGERTTAQSDAVMAKVGAAIAQWHAAL